MISRGARSKTGHGNCGQSETSPPNHGGMVATHAGGVSNPPSRVGADPARCHARRAVYARGNRNQCAEQSQHDVSRTARLALTAKKKLCTTVNAKPQASKNYGQPMTPRRRQRYALSSNTRVANTLAKLPRVRHNLVRSSHQTREDSHEQQFNIICAVV